MTGPQATVISGGRLHLHHGPIDLIIKAYGRGVEAHAAMDQAQDFFQTVLSDLSSMLPTLRRPVHAGIQAGLGPVADRMVQAVARHSGFVTPMAAVAGAVADATLAAMIQGRQLDRAYVNNGGDIAIWLAPGTTLTAAGGPGLTDQITLSASAPSRGLATSGWRGRSHSLGIADAVTVLAATAAQADVAATLIANAVDLPGHPAIARVPAKDLSPDSDLGTRPVTTDVGQLGASDITRALAAGRPWRTRCVAKV